MIRLMVPPLPAVSRPSKITITRSPRCTIHSCIRTNSVCNRASSFSYADLLTTFGLDPLEGTGTTAGDSSPVPSALARGTLALVEFFPTAVSVATHLPLMISG